MTQNILQNNIGLGSNTSLNISAPIVFVQSLQRQVNEDDIQALIQSQKHMLNRFEKTNEMLINCNSLLAIRHTGASKELKKHITFLIELKKDLETVFRRIRFLKMKLSQQYPDAFSACNNMFNTLDEEEEQDEKERKTHLQAPDINGATNVSSSYSQESSILSITSPSSSD